MSGGEPPSVLSVGTSRSSYWLWKFIPKEEKCIGLLCFIRYLSPVVWSKTKFCNVWSLLILTKNLPSNSGLFSTSCFSKDILWDAAAVSVPKKSISESNIPSIVNVKKWLSEELSVLSAATLVILYKSELELPSSKINFTNNLFSAAKGIKEETLFCTP